MRCKRMWAPRLRTTPTHFTCFTRTKLQILTPEELRARRIWAPRLQFTRSNGRNLQILTRLARDTQAHVGASSADDALNVLEKVLSLLALLVQKYKY